MEPLFSMGYDWLLASLVLTFSPHVGATEASGWILGLLSLLAARARGEGTR